MESRTPEVPREILSHRYPELDALRGLAAATVIFHHALLLWDSAPWHRPLMLTPARIFFAGPQAVVLFFVLSGFVLSAQQSSPRRPNFLGYLLKRLCRIYLPFLGALLFAYMFATLLYLRVPTDNVWYNGTWSHKPQLMQLLQTALTSLHNTGEFNTAFWSVLVEIRVSLIFPLLFWLVKRIPAWCTGALIVVILAVNPLLADSGSELIMQAVALFLLGTLAFLHIRILRDWMSSRTRAVRIALLILSLGMYTYGGSTINFPPAHTIATNSPMTGEGQVSGPLNGSHPHVTASVELRQVRYILCGIASLLLMLGAITSPALRQFLVKPFLLRLGALSYSIYLVHGTVLFALARTLFGRIPVVAFLALYVALVYVVSEIFHLFIDAPSLELGRRVGKPDRKNV